MKYSQRYIGLLLIIITGCKEEFTSEKWMRANATERNKIYFDNYLELNQMLIGYPISNAVELLGEPGYAIDDWGVPIRNYGYDILDSNDTYNGYYWLEVTFDTTTNIVTGVRTRDD